MFRLGTVSIASPRPESNPKAKNSDITNGCIVGAGCQESRDSCVTLRNHTACVIMQPLRDFEHFSSSKLILYEIKQTQTFIDSSAVYCYAKMIAKIQEA